MTYEEILASFNHQMLAGHDDRAALLAKVRRQIGCPDQAYHIVHLAGTNGKGSTGSLIANSLQSAGYRVGYFSSPALLDEREMIRVNGALIPKEAFVQTYQHLVQELPAGLSAADLTVFEWWTLIALQYFKDQSVDWAVIECGLGGSDDATNVIKAPDLAVITHLGLDHTNILGPKIEDIAASASGIIKTGSRGCLLAPGQDPRATEVVAHRCQQRQVPLIQSGQQVAVGLADGRFDLAKGMPIVVNGKGLPDFRVQTPLIGTYQLANLTTAVEAYLTLSKQGVFDSEQVLSQAISQTRMPLRMQVINRQPLTMLDAAHNPDGAKELVKTIRTFMPTKKVIMVLGFLADKNWREMAAMYRSVAQTVFVTTPNNPKRALAAQTLASEIPGAQVVDRPEEALRAAQAAATEHDVVIATGSFYLVKELLPQVTSGQAHSHLDQRSSY